MPVHDLDGDPFETGVDGGGTIDPGEDVSQLIGRPFPPSSGSQSPTADAQQEESADGAAQSDVEPFDPRWMLPFEGLLNVGYLEREFEVYGHKVLLRTITVADELELALLIQQWANTIGSVRAYQTGVVSAALLSVDGRSLPEPLTMSPGDTPVRNRFDYLRNNYRPPVINLIYEKYLLLEAEVERVTAAMGKAPS